MAGILGSLIVELRANVADFVSGMSGASYAAKKAGSDIEGAFSGVGEVAGALLAPLGELGEQISETFSRVGEWGAAATKELAKFSGEFGLVGTAAGFAVAAIAAVEVAAVGLTLHTAEAAAKLYELSQSTGVSVEALSGFKFVAEQNGVAAETMSLALERMGRSAFAAATAPVGSILAQSNAYARLGISLRDADGSLRSSQDLFEAIAAKFEAMPDGIAKSALAIEIFGRGGAALIPVLDRGRDGIDALLAEAQKLGVVMSTDTASAAEEFEGRLNVMKSAAEGAADELLVKMLPALEYLTAELTDISNGPNPLQRTADDIASLVKGTVGVADTWIHAFETVGIVIETIGGLVIETFLAIARAANAAVNAVFLDFSGLKDAAKADAEGFASVWSNAIGGIKSAWEKNSEFLGGLTAPRSPYTLPQIGKGAPDTTPASVNRSNAIADTIAKLQAQSEAEGQLANAISGTTANTILATAAAEAQKDIAELSVRAEREKIPVTDAAKASIRDIVTLTAAYKAAYGDNKELEDFIQKTELQAKSIEALAAAERQGAAAIEKAQEAAKIAPFEKQASDIAGVIAQLKQLGTGGNLLGSLQQSLKDLADHGATKDQLGPLQAAIDGLKKGVDPIMVLQHALDELREKLGAATAAVQKLNVAEQEKSAGAKTSALGTQIAEQQKYTLALLAGSAALRQLKIDEQVATVQREGPSLNPATVNVFRSALEQLSSVERVNAAAEKVASSQAFLDTQKQIDALEQLRAAELEAGADTSATNLQIYDEGIRLAEEQAAYVASSQNAELAGAAKIYDVKKQLIEQWDQEAEKAGDFGDRVRAELNELSLDGQNLGASLTQATTQFVEGFEDQLAKLVVTGKANWEKLYESFEESLVKATLKKATSMFTGTLEKAIFGGAIPGGAGGKPDGSSSNPFYVLFGAGGSPIGKPESSATGIFGAIERLFGHGKGVGPLPIDTDAYGGPGGGPSAFAGIGSLPFSPSSFGGPGGGPSALLGAGISGLGGSSATGTEASPFYVIPTDESGNVLGESGFGGGSGSGGGFLSMLGSGGSDSDTGSGGGGGGFLGFLSGLFSSGGGAASGAGADMSGVDAADFIGMADGGDVTPGSAYLVGEEHPEIFAPRTAGRIIPDFSKAMRSRPQGTTINFHVHGVQDVNSFNKSRGQIMASMHREMEAQRKRNG